MSNIIQRLCFGVLLSLGITATPTMVQAQQAQPSTQTQPQQPTVPSPRTRPPPLPEPGMPLSDTVVLDPIYVPRLRIRSVNENGTFNHDQAVNRGDVHSTRRRAIDPAEDYRVRRIVFAASLTALTAGAAEAAIYFGIVDAVFNGSSSSGPALMISGAVTGVFLVPAVYTLAAYALEGTGGYGFAWLGNVLGIGASVALGAALITSAGSLAAFLVISPLTLALCTAGIYELSSRPVSTRTTTRSTPIFPSIFASETTRGLTLSGSF